MVGSGAVRSTGCDALLVRTILIRKAMAAHQARGSRQRRPEPRRLLADGRQQRDVPEATAGDGPHPVLEPEQAGPVPQAPDVPARTPSDHEGARLSSDFAAPRCGYLSI